jgi:phage baseplate assembly protein W
MTALTATNFLVPFQLTTQGTTATTADPNLIAMQRVRSIISTPPGARVMLPDYGVNLPGYLFSSDLSTSTAQIEKDITTALATYEPTIDVLEVTPVINNNLIGIEDINVEFSVSDNEAYTPVQTATVLVGGSVVGN